MKHKGQQVILGLDIGAASIGWTLMEAAKNEDDTLSPSGILAAGVRIFTEGVENFETGRGDPPNLQRRESRQVRRQTDRRRRRRIKLFLLLEENRLLPQIDREKLSRLKGKERFDFLAQERHRVMTELDADLLAKQTTGGGLDDQTAQLLPYLTRAKALDHPLEPHELGRMFYQFGQRRGFLSNKKAQGEDDESGKVKSAIAELNEKMKELNARTLGEYLSKQTPHARRIRGEGHYTHRQMYLDEFELLWARQAPHHPEILTPEFKTKLHNAIFHQRPLKSVKQFVGFCSLEPLKRRASAARPEAQRFRLLQRLNDLEFICLDDSTHVRMADVKGEAREKIIRHLETHNEVSFSSLRKLLSLPKGKWTSNFEQGGEKKMKGDRTSNALSPLFGERWWDMDLRLRSQVVEDLLGIDNAEALERVGRERWKLGEEEAKTFAAVTLERGYSSLSLSALRKLLPHLESGVSYATARNEVYGVQKQDEPLDTLPLVEKAVPSLRNPAVSRVLTELRKVVNNLTSEHGKPDIIRVELARQLKQSAKVRQEIQTKNKRNQTTREKAKEKIIQETGAPDPRGGDILKAVLGEECGMQCVYCGRQYSMAQLMSAEAQIEHIIPFSRSLDNSFMNKTISCVKCNAKKGNKTPREAFGDTAAWAEMEDRASKNWGKPAYPKLKRFRADKVADVEEFTEGFTNRDLNTTSYATTLACDYLGLLYGGRIVDGKTRVQGTNGLAASMIRDELGLNSILGDGGNKSRDDHRHHTVDAIVAALTDAGMLRKLSTAAARAQQERRRRFAPVTPPWPDFLADAREAIDAVTVSHRGDRKVRGALHQETIYSKEATDDKGKNYVKVKKPLSKLSANELSSVSDPYLKEAIEKKIRELGFTPKESKKWNKAFEDEANLPVIGGSKMKRVTIRKSQAVKTIGSGPTERNVITGANHHVAVFETVDAKGKIKWVGKLVTLMEAAERLKKKLPAVDRNAVEGGKFLFSLCRGDTVELEVEGKSSFYTVKILSYVISSGIVSPKIAFIRSNDARIQKEIKKEGPPIWVEVLIDPLRNKWKMKRKVTVSPTGLVRTSRD